MKRLFFPALNTFDTLVKNQLAIDILVYFWIFNAMPFTESLAYSPVLGKELRKGLIIMFMWGETSCTFQLSYMVSHHCPLLRLVYTGKQRFNKHHKSACQGLPSPWSRLCPGPSPPLPAVPKTDRGGQLLQVARQILFRLLQ